MKVLLTGISGIVGKYLLKELLQVSKYTKIVSLSRKARYLYEDHPQKDDTQYKSIQCYGELRHDCTRLITQYQPDVVFHLAGVATTSSPPKEIWESNVTTTFNLLEACKSLDKVCFVYAGTIVDCLQPLTLYAASKKAGMVLVHSYSSMYKNIEGVTLRFPAVAGAGNKHGVVKAVVDKLMNDSLTMQLFGNYPGSIKPIVWAGQLAEKIATIVDNPTLYGPVYTLCSPDITSVEDIAEIACRLVGRKKEIQWDSSKVWPGDHSVVYPDKKYKYVEMYSSQYAVELAIQDILKEDYHYVK